MSAVARIPLGRHRNLLLLSVDTPLSESRYADILEGWVQEEREVFEEHDAEALNELDNHEHDNEPFEEEPDLDDEENSEQEEDHDDEEQNQETEEVENKSADDDDGDDDDNVTAEEQEDEDGDDDEEDEDQDSDDTQEIENDLNLPMRRIKREVVEEENDDDDDDAEDDLEVNATAEDNDSVEEPKIHKETPPPSHHVPFEEVRNIVRLSLLFQ